MALVGPLGILIVSISSANGLKYLPNIEDCTPCGASGLILPLFPCELCWKSWLRVTMYFLGLLYFFLGVAIASDIFMASIEKITSKTKQRVVKFELAGKVQYKLHDDKVWNDTIANLTLMALGSSAPEILLSCIEIIGNKFQSGKLGAGTIVGSAAFNLLVIISVCIIFVPKGEVRKIKGIKVFIVTSLFSLFAYAWMVIVLEVLSKNEVELWEAIVTLLLFPMLVVVAWWADHEFCVRGIPARKVSVLDDEEANKDGVPSQENNGLYKDGIINQEALIALYNQMRTINPELTEEETASLVARKLIDQSQHSHLYSRAGVSRILMGSPQIMPVIDEKLKEVYTALDKEPMAASHRKDSDLRKAIIEFEGVSVAVMENIGTTNVKLIRRGRLDNEVCVKVETFDGTANADDDYIPFSYNVTFAPNSTEILIPVTVIDDNQWEPEEEFFIRASIVNDAQEAVLGRIPIMEIVILDDDNPGSVSFIQRGMFVKQDCGAVQLPLKRSNGCDGVVTVSYKTVDGTALCPHDYTESHGTITFPHGEPKGTISIPITNIPNSTKTGYFFVVLQDTTGGVHLGEISKIKVTISNEEVPSDTIEKLMHLAAENVESLQVGNQSYGAQFKIALSVNGGNIEEATTADYIFHVITFPWKVILACIPPVGYCGGWLCFLSTLILIGFLTALIGDMAESFGCLIGMKDTVTAITFVALGTSVPDLFASKAAVASEKHADNAIGNVTGSNSVNVFLGLGLPWTIAAMYHEINGTKFVVIPGDLTFSVVIYSATAVVAMFILFLRRLLWGAELGGGNIGKWTAGSIFLVLWFIYIALSAIKSYEIYNFF